MKHDRTAPVNESPYFTIKEDDVSLVVVLLKGYSDNVKITHKNISHWYKELESWFHIINSTPGTGKLDIFKDILY